MHPYDIPPWNILHVAISDRHIVNTTCCYWLYLLHLSPYDFGVLLHVTAVEDAALDDVVVGAEEDDATTAVEEHADLDDGLFVV